MALIDWNEDEKEKDELFSTPKIAVTSVQDGAWQPAPSGANAPAVDEPDAGQGGVFGQQPQQQEQPENQENYLLSDQKAQVDEAKRQNDAAIEEARRQAAAAEAAEAAAAAEANAMAQSQNLAQEAQQPKKKGKSKYRNNKKGDDGVMGFLKGIGAGIQQGLGAVGDVAIKGGGVIGAIGKNDRQLVKHVAEVEKVRNWLGNQKDITGNKLIGTRDVEQNAADIISGRGDLQDYAALGGKSLQVGIDASMFLNPAALAAKGVATKGATSAATSVIEKALANPAVRTALRDAGFFGGLQGVATGAQTYGQTGELDEALKNATTDALIGGALQGTLDLAGAGIGSTANKALKKFQQPEQTRLGDEIVQDANGNPVSPQERELNPATDDGNISFQQQGEVPEFTPVASGVSSVPLANEVTPVADGVVQSPVDNVTPVNNGTIPLDELEARAGQENPELTPVQAPVDNTQPAPSVVADGVVQPSQVIPAADPNMPVIRPEQVNELQDARAGASQADEAAINQRLQQIENETPSVRKDYQESTGDTEIDSKIKDVVEMSPDEYLRQAFEATDGRLGGDYDSWLRSNAQDSTVAEKYAEAMRNGDRFPLPYIDKAMGSQDGRNRAIAAKLAGRNKMPVGIIPEMTTAEKIAFAREQVAKHPENSYLGNKYRRDLAELSKSAESPTEHSPRDRAGITGADDYEISLQKLDDAYEGGRITDEEFVQIEDELFNAANQRGEAMAETSGNKSKSNQPLPESLTPLTKNSLPEMEAPTGNSASISPERQSRKDFANVFTRSTDSNSDMGTRLRNATGMTQEAGSEVAQILADGNVTGKQAERITKLFDRAAEIAENNKATQKQYRKDFINGGRETIDDAPARKRNRETDEAAYVRSRLNAELNKLERKGDFGERLTQDFENVVRGKNSNQLLGAPIERGLTAEVIGNAMNTIKAPIKQVRGATMHGMPGKSAVKRLVRDLKTRPKTVTEGYKYLIGNTYRAAMTPAQALADTRKGAFRTELTKYAYKGKIGKELSNKDAEKVSRMAGNDMEALVNMGAGVDNGTINILAYRKALKQWKKFIETGSEADYGNFMDTIDRQTSIVDKLAQGFSTQGKNRAQRAGLTLVNALLPYMRNAVNMSTRGVVLDLNPFTLSLLDGIRTDQRGFMSNLALGIKNKTVDYAVLAALSSVLTYNDGTDPDTVDQPRGVSIHLGGDEYFAIRGTPLELPLGALMVAKQLAQDGVEGKFKDVGYYGGMITPSIPYADYMTSHGNVIDSLEKLGTEEGDAGYAAKNFLVGNAKSLTPFSNNNIEASLSRLGDGESLTAKSVYASKEVSDGEGGTKKVADMPQWYLNSLANNNLGKVLPFVPDRSELKDSRDAAGRVRTVDNQGSWMRKKINDKNTATYNDTITDLVKFAREEGLGKGTQDMFDTFNEGKNNNFKTIMGSIYNVNKGGNENKLKKNDKLYGLSQQIRDGFFGDGSELLKIGDDTLYSDVSMPNSTGTKNSSKPISIASIKNAVAATDLPEAERNRMYQISQQVNGLYAKVKSKEMTYDQYKGTRAGLESEYQSILGGSKSYKKMNNLMTKLDSEGFFDEGGLGSTRSGQAYLWNSFNALLGDKGKTPAADYPKDDKGFTPWGKRGGGGSKGSGFGATKKPGDRGNTGVKWNPVSKRQQAAVASAKYTPVKIKVKLGSEVKKDRTQNYADRSF